MDIIVIGSGFGGLAAAIRLQAQGHQVTILEKRDKPGGRAYVYKQDGFIFDGGPTIITAPWLLEDLFAISGKSLKDYVTLKKIDPFYNIRFEDGTVFRYNDDTDAIMSQIEKISPRDVEGYKKFSAATEAIYKTGFDLIGAPFHRVSAMIKILPDLIRLRSDRSVYSFVSKFIKNEKIRQVFSFHPLLIGGNPFQTTSIYALIHKLEQKSGVFFAMGGTGALVDGLVKLFEDIGGKIFLNSEVEEIVIEDKKLGAKGVRLKNGTVLKSDAVVSNADVAFTYSKMIAPQFRKKYTDKKIESMDYSMSLFVLYFGTNKKFDTTAHHEILLGARYKELLEDIFHKKHLAGDFSLYLHRPTATDPSLAPPGCDSWYVLSPVPNLAGVTDWKKTAKSYRDLIVRYLEERYLPGLSESIVTEHYIDPLHFRDTLNSHLGAAFSVAPTLMQSAYLRPHNISEDIPNLYFVGAGTHPGAGLPGVLSSGKITADLIGRA